MFLKFKYLSCLFLLLSCGQDSLSYKPESGSVSGKVTFNNIDNWPSIGSITISLSKNWPLSNIVGPPINYSSITVNDLDSGYYYYLFEDLDLDSTFGAIAVAWKDPLDSNSATNQHVLGAYGGSLEQNFFDAEKITLTNEEYEKNNLNFIADMSLVNQLDTIESGSISGSITFSGAWPDDPVYISLNSFCCPLISTPDEFYKITSDQLVNNQIDYFFNNIIFGEYYIAVFRQTNWETIGAYPSYENPESISLNTSNSIYDSLNFSLTFIN